MNPYHLPENSRTPLEKHLRVLQNAPSPDLTRGRARVLAEMEKRRARVAQMPRRMTFAASLGAGFAVMFLMIAMTLVSNPAVTAVALTRTDTLQAETFSPAALPGNVLTPAMREYAPMSLVRTPAPNVAPEPPHAPSFKNTRPVSPTSAN